MKKIKQNTQKYKYVNLVLWLRVAHKVLVKVLARAMLSHSSAR